MENFPGVMGMNLKGNLKMEKFQELEFLNERMEKNILDNGKIIKCMGLENLNGQMGKCIKDIIKKMLSMESVHLFDLTEESMKVSGRMGCNMALDIINGLISLKTNRNKKKENGIKEIVYNG